MFEAPLDVEKQVFLTRALASACATGLFTVKVDLIEFSWLTPAAGTHVKRHSLRFSSFGVPVTKRHCMCKEFQKAAVIQLRLRN